MNDIKGGKEGKKKAGRARKRRKTETCEIATSWDLEGLVVESVTVESYNRDMDKRLWYWVVSESWVSDLSDSEAPRDT